jgi:hypothetical protein
MGDNLEIDVFEHEVDVTQLRNNDDDMSADDFEYASHEETTGVIEDLEAGIDKKAKRKSKFDKMKAKKLLKLHDADENNSLPPIESNQQQNLALLTREEQLRQLEDNTPDDLSILDRFSIENVVDLSIIKSSSSLFVGCIHSVIPS